MRLFVSALCLLVFISCKTSNKEANYNSNNTPHAVEADAIKKAVDDAYRSISIKSLLNQMVSILSMKKKLKELQINLAGLQKE